jgi:hypothetical protein
MPRNPDTSRNAAIGCFMVPLGAASGSMIGVLVSKIVAWVTKAPGCANIPTCDWYVYAGWGMLLGGLTLPVLVLTRLLSSAGPSDERPDTNRS